MQLRSYAKEFFSNEDGMELLQVAIVVALAAGLITVIAYLFTQVGKKIGDAGDQVSNVNTNANVNTNPYSNTGGNGSTQQQP